MTKTQRIKCGRKPPGWLVAFGLGLSLLWACEAQFQDDPVPETTVPGKPHLVATPHVDRVELNWGWLTWGSGYRATRAWQAPAGFILMHSKTGTDALTEVAYLPGDATRYVLSGLAEQQMHYFGLKAFWQTGDTFASNQVAVMAGPQAVPQPLFPQAEVSRYWGSWSPLGTQLAYMSEQPQVAEGLGVYVYDLEEDHETFWRGGQQPDWSPEGEQLVAITDLAFNRNHPDSSSYLTLLSPGSSTLVNGGEGHLLHPAWSKDGRWWLYLHKAPTEPDYTLFQMPVGGTYEPRPLAIPTRELSALPRAIERSPAHPRWHPTEPAVVYHRFASKSYLGQELYAQDIFLFSLTTEVVMPLIESPWNDTRPVYSPDGRYLAFVSDRSGQPGLWLYVVESQQLRQLYGRGFPRVDDRHGRLDWAPDGRQILFNAWVNDTLTSLFTLEID